MKNIIAIFSISLAILSQATANSQPLLQYIISNKVTLNAGTPVILETTDLNTSHDMTDGQVVHFRVKMNVKAEGDVVIATYAMGLGRVKSIEPSSYNDEEKFMLEVTSVQSVDGQLIPLSGQELVIKAKFTGERSTSNSGVTVIAYVLNDIKIKP